MKQLLLVLLFIQSISILSQDVTADTTLVNRYFEMGDSLYNIKKFEASKNAFEKASILYSKYSTHKKYLNCLVSQAYSYLRLDSIEKSICIAERVLSS